MAWLNLFSHLGLGILPSLIWLSFYLKRDAHPEPKKKVVKIFLWGMGIAFLAAAVELLFDKVLDWQIFPVFVSALYSIFGIAFIEEASKYLVFRQKVRRDPEFDEPLDTMIYMIIAALGFAASENIFLFLAKGFSFYDTLIFSFFRFVSATFLHALCSGIFGFFIALSFFRGGKEKTFTFLGLLSAILLHAIYNFSIIRIEETSQFLIPTLILITLAIFISLGFQKLKRLKSVCQV